MKWSKWMGGLFGLVTAVIVMSMPTMAKEKFKTFEKTTYTIALQESPALCVCETQLSVPEVTTISVMPVPVEQAHIILMKTHYARVEPPRRMSRHFSSMYLRTSPASLDAAYRVSKTKTRTIWKN